MNKSARTPVTPKKVLFVRRKQISIDCVFSVLKVLNRPLHAKVKNYMLILSTNAMKPARDRTACDVMGVGT